MSKYKYETLQDFIESSPEGVAQMCIPCTEEELLRFKVLWEIAREKKNQKYKEKSFYSDCTSLDDRVGWYANR